NTLKIKNLDNVCILGLGLVGGSLALALESAEIEVIRTGWSRSESTRDFACENAVVDKVYDTPEEAVREAGVVVLAGPISCFAGQFKQIADFLPKGCIVTDVGSTKRQVAKWAKKYLPDHVDFVGSHPMAGSEQQGIEFARGDLFNGGFCFVTPTEESKASSVTVMKQIWQALNMKVIEMTSQEHDQTVAMISHLPHIIAASLVNISDLKQIVYCGKGFLDTTRIASGPENVWRDILMTNSSNTARSIDKLIKDLTRYRDMLKAKDADAIESKLLDARQRRNELVEIKMQRKELPE
ncbi:MAG: prephenate dehydrogenase/arogenate dehydrogenase family protein, partial [Opitutales bacterium]|nr:prephenate dehydrogenase/arogenate dehydrogenase family protein [Opitutales bacterium]